MSAQLHETQTVVAQAVALSPTSSRVALLMLLKENFPAVPMPEHLRLVPISDPEAMAAWALAALRAIAWRSAKTPPAAHPAGADRPVTVLAVVDDPRFRINGDEPFVDVASWWPAAQRWTVTHQVRSDDAVDYPVRVAAWKPLDELPPPWSDLWREGGRS